MAVLTSTGITFSDSTSQSTAATAAALVTTANVLSATAGASGGAVGTYAFLSDGSSSTLIGNTRAGSALRAASMLSGCVVSIYGGATQSGTWRAMGSANNYPNASVWLRIS
jgi:hypothetical protein